MIRFDHITKKYPGTNRPALNSIDVEILRGEFVFLVGASGSGKSSCLRLVLKEEKPTSGSIHVMGQDLRSISNRKVPYFRRNIGVVFQDFRLLPNKTVYENVAFSLQVIGKSRGFIQEAVPDTLQMVGLAEKSQRLPHELSGGEQQRVAIARAIVNKPQILLADEPTGNLDPTTSAGIMALLDRINAGGTTVLMATHEAGIVDQMQRRVIELSAGQIVRDERQGGYATQALPIITDTGMMAEVPTKRAAVSPSAPSASGATAITPSTTPTTETAAPDAATSTSAGGAEALAQYRRTSDQEAPAHITEMTATQAVPVQAPAAQEPTVEAPAAPVAPVEPVFVQPTFVQPAPAQESFQQSAQAAAVDAAPPAQPTAPPPPRFAPPAPLFGSASDSGMPSSSEPGVPTGSRPATDPTTGVDPAETERPMTRPVLPVTNDDIPEQLTLAEKLGLRAPGEKPNPTGEQNVGPTR